MIAALVMSAAAAYLLWWCWRVITADRRHGCPMCPRRVLSVSRHLAWAHEGQDMTCCSRVIPDDMKALHWRLHHEPRPSGPEDRPTWSRR